MQPTDHTANASIARAVLSHRGARIHLVGILGAGMSPIAELLFSLGFAVSGTDRADGPSADRLRTLGIPVTPYHTDRDVPLADLVAYSLAVPKTSPELVRARECNIPTVTRGELLGAIFTLYECTVAVSGTHGKSTTTAMLDAILHTSTLDPTVISGATLSDGTPLRIGRREILIAEACEYKNSFLSLKPTHALITNIEQDHTDFFTTLDSVLDSFLAFANTAERVYLNLSCQNSRGLKPRIKAPTVTYGTSDADYALLHYEMTDRGTDMLVKIGGAVYPVHLSVHGYGNMLDAVGAIAVSHSMGVPVLNILDSLADFSGIKRRMERIATVGGTAIYYDYAHHPTEIKNTLTTLRALHGNVTVIFRPHTYSRTLSLMDDFAEALAAADFSVILDVYAAREPYVEGVSNLLATRIGSGAIYSTDTDALALALGQGSAATVLMGAGDVDVILEQIKSMNK